MFVEDLMKLKFVHYLQSLILHFFIIIIIIFLTIIFFSSLLSVEL